MEYSHVQGAPPSPKRSGGGGGWNSSDLPLQPPPHSGQTQPMSHALVPIPTLDPAPRSGGNRASGGGNNRVDSAQRRVRHPGLGDPSGGGSTPSSAGALVLYQPQPAPAPAPTPQPASAYHQAYHQQQPQQGVNSVRSRQAQSSAGGPNAPNRPRPAYVRRGGRHSIRQSFVADAGQMTADERGTFAHQLRRERAEKHVMSSGAGERVQGEGHGRGMEHRGGAMPGMPDDGGGGSSAESGGGAVGGTPVLRQMLEDIRKQCKSLEGRLQEQKSREAANEAEQRAQESRMQQSEQKMWASAQEASNAWATVASDREQHRDEVHKLTAIIRQFDEDKRALTHKSETLESKLAIERAEGGGYREQAHEMERVRADAAASKAKAEALAEIAQNRRDEVAVELKSALTLLESKQAELQKVRYRATASDSQVSVVRGRVYLHCSLLVGRCWCARWSRCGGKTRSWKVVVPPPRGASMLGEDRSTPLTSPSSSRNCRHSTLPRSG